MPKYENSYATFYGDFQTLYTLLDCIYIFWLDLHKYFFKVGDGVTPARIAHIIFAMVCPVYIPFGVTSQLE